MMDNDWNGITNDGQPVSMTTAQMSEYALATNKQFQIGWSDQYTFPDDCSTLRLRGARFVRTRGNESYAASAERAGWKDLAEKFKEYGL